MINITTEAEFVKLLPLDNDYISAQNINKSILVLKQEQLTIVDEVNLISDKNAQDIVYNTNSSTQTSLSTDNEILNNENPENVSSAINALDRLKANKNGNPNETFMVLDSTEDNSAVSRSWSMSNLNNKASKTGDSSNTFDVANPITNYNAANKLYVDALKSDIKTSLLDYAHKTGDSSNTFDVANPITNYNAANKLYVDTKLSNVISSGGNNIIKKIEVIINANSMSITDIGIPMVTGQIMIFSGSVLMYEGQDYNVKNTEIHWLKNRTDGERITVLFLEENALTGILDPIYLKQTGGIITGNISCNSLPEDNSHLSNKLYVDTKKSESIFYTDSQINQLNNYLVPPGGIISFSGTADEISALSPYWYLCDGTNNTPDLRGRFILGSGTNGTDTFIDGQIGGSYRKSISIDNMPPHNHELLMSEEKPSSHDSTGFNELTLKPVASGSGNSIVINISGSGVPMDIMPPYYAMAYIMRSKDQVMLNNGMLA